MVNYVKAPAGVPSFGGANTGDVLTYDGTKLIWSAGGGGSSTFLGLLDTPVGFTTPNALYKVSSAGTAVTESLATITDAGSLGIPASQKYTVGGKDVKSFRLITHVDVTDFTTRVLTLTDDDLDGGILEVELDGDITGLDYTIKIPDSSAANDEQFLTIKYQSGTVMLNVTTVSGIQLISSSATQAIEKAGDAITVNSDFTDTHYLITQDSRINTSSVDILSHGDSGTVTDLVDLEDWNRIYHSPTLISGGDITVDGTNISTTDLQFVIRNADSESAPLKPAYVTGLGTTAVPDNDTFYTVVDYNSGSPIMTTASSLVTIPCTNTCGVHVVSRVNSNIDHFSLGDYSNNFASRYVKAEASTGWLKYGGAGLVVSEVGTRNISITAGSLYIGAKRFATPALDTSATGTFTYYYRSAVAGVWTEQASSTQINHTQYDNGSGTLQTGASNKYYVHAVFCRVNNPTEYAVIYPQVAHNSLEEARAAAGVPANVPAFAEPFSTARFIGSIITKYNTVAFEDILTPFGQALTSANPVSHDNLAGISLAGSGITYGHIDAGAQTLYGAKTFDSGVVINEGGGDNDTRIEGDTDTNLVYVDAGTNRVILGSTAGASKLTIRNSESETVAGVAGFDGVSFTSSTGYDYYVGKWVTGGAGYFNIRDQNGVEHIRITGAYTNGSAVGQIGFFNGDVYGAYDASFLTFTDRTPYPESLQQAIDSVNSMDRLPDGEYGDKDHQLDHSKLHPYLCGNPRVLDDGTIQPTRDMSASISCINEVVKHLLAENAALKATLAEAVREIKEINSALGYETTGLGD